jgi:amidase
MTAIAHGGDGTGSLRYPAAACGVVTLKPSRGRIPHVSPAEQPDPVGVWTEFVLTRSVRDLAGVLDAIGPLPPGERWRVPSPVRAYVDQLATPLRPLRVGLLLSDVMVGIPTDAACVDAVRKAGGLLTALGHHVAESHPPALDSLLLRTAQAIATWGSVARAAQLSWLERAIGRELQATDLDPEAFVATEAATRTTDAQLAEAQETIIREVRPVADWFVDHDILITPVLRQPAWPLGQSGGAADAGVFPGTVSVTGQPAGVVPVDWTAGGLPVGIQIVAAHPRDDIVLNVMAQLEQANPWSNRWPAIANG